MSINELLNKYERLKRQVPFAENETNDFSLSAEARQSLTQRALPLFELVKKCLLEKYPIDYDNANNNEDTKRILERFNYELSLIIGEGYCEYYLVKADYINWAKSQRIPIDTHGSTGCSFIAYLLGICDINPFKFDLPFERLSPLTHFKHFGFPTESSAEGREKIVKYLRKKFGEENVLNIFVRRENLRKCRIHATSVFVLNKGLGEYVPSKKQLHSNIAVLTNEEYKSLGLQEIRIIGSKELETISKIEAEIRLYNKSFSIDKIPFDDSVTFQLFQNGDTLGIFLFEYNNLKYICNRLKLSCFDEIVALIGLNRTFVMNHIGRYIQGKFDISKREVIHPLLNEILAETYGVLVYQEQFMLSVKKLAGYSLIEADILRRDLVKRDSGNMPQYKKDFIERCAKTNNTGADEAAEIFDKLSAYSIWSFSKAHAISMAKISYKMAYLKANYRKEFEKITGRNE